MDLSQYCSARRLREGVFLDVTPRERRWGEGSLAARMADARTKWQRRETGCGGRA